MMTHPGVFADTSRLICELGDAVERQWAGCDYAIDAFAEIARRRLEESEIMRNGAKPLLRWFINQPNVPDQRLRPFGEPPINLFSNERFFIELLTWTTSTHAIHEHAFAGAFGLLGGKSYHSMHRFSQSDRPIPSFSIGKLSFERYEILSPGAVRAIPPGSELIHVNMHLESPSFTIVIRTRSLEEYRPQLRYYDCGVAIDETFEPEPFKTKTALLRSMASFDPEEFWIAAADAMESADLSFAIGILQIAARFCIREPGKYERLLQVGLERHPTASSAVDAFARRSAWESAAIRRRYAVSDPNGILFIKLMMTAKTPDILAKLFAELNPKSPIDELISKYVPDLYQLAF